MTEASVRTDAEAFPSIKGIDSYSVHRITSGQVVVDLQTAVKELIENSLDAGATNIEVRFRDYGLKSIEVVDNGSGVAPQDHESIALKHHTSKLSSFSDLTTVLTFGFRGEALSSLCALSESVSVTTATKDEAPMGTVLEMDRNGSVASRTKVARQRGTTVTVMNLFKPLPVRRKELERNAKREFGKALNLLNAYALVPCANENDLESGKRGVRLTVSNQAEGGRKTVQLRTPGIPSTRASVSALWGPRALDNLVELDLSFSVEPERSTLRRQTSVAGSQTTNATPDVEMKVKGLISKFSLGCGRTGTDRQFFYINGRPCNLTKIQKAFNEIYRSFNANQAPFIVADFIIPTHACDINVSPDKRTIFLHSEGKLIDALKIVLEDTFSTSRATMEVNEARKSGPSQHQQTTLYRNGSGGKLARHTITEPADLGDEEHGEREDEQQAEESSLQVSSNHTREDSSHSRSSANQAFSSPHGSTARDANAEAHLPENYESFGSVTDDVAPTVPNIDRIAEDQSTADQHTHVHSAAPKPGRTPTQARSGFGSTTVTQSAASPEQQARPSHSVVSDRARSESPVVLSTQSASWNQSNYQKIEEVERFEMSVEARNSNVPGYEEGPPRKKQRLLESEPGRRSSSSGTRSGSGSPSRYTRIPSKRGIESDVMEGRKAKIGLRMKLQGFARTGSQVVVDPESGSDEELNEEPSSERESNEEPDEEQGLTEDLRSHRQEDERHKASQSQGSRNVASDEGVTNVLASDGAGQESLFLPDETDEEQVEIVDAEPVPEPDIEEPEVIDLSSDKPQPVQEVVDPDDSSLGLSQTSSLESRIKEEVVRTFQEEDITLRFDLPRVLNAWQDLRRQSEKVATERDSTLPEVIMLEGDAGVVNDADDERAVLALSRVIDKNDFRSMEVVGQFNLGFIIARRRKYSGGHDGEGAGHRDRKLDMDDLFIVDQHAADEKYNFETLQLTTRLESQKLFRPEPLELTAADELLAMENIDVVRQNGFDVEVNEDAAPGQGRRLQLVARPVSKSTVFDMKDLEELIHLMQDAPPGRTVRCSKTRAMFAMRACRKSIMVGKPLTKGQMASVIRHMGTMDQPWNCPHGRPTMRHLSDLLHADLEPMSRKINWETFNPE